LEFHPVRIQLIFCGVDPALQYGLSNEMGLVMKSSEDASMTNDVSITTEPSDRSLIAKIREGDDIAAEGLYRKYSDRIMGLVQSQMGELLRSVTEPEDIVQSVFKSVFRGVLSGAYEAPEGQTIWQLLAVISVNKVRRKARSQLAERRDVRRTSALDDESDAGLTLDNQEIELSVKEALQKLDPLDQIVVQYRLEGHTVEDIAAKTERSRRTIERSLQRIRDQLTEMLEIDLR
jgi:RNA polymerase sigma-70 factor (ECF subfamily)